MMQHNTVNVYIYIYMPSFQIANVPLYTLEQVTLFDVCCVNINCIPERSLKFNGK